MFEKATGSKIFRVMFCVDVALHAVGIHGTRGSGSLT